MSVFFTKLSTNIYDKQEFRSDFSNLFSLYIRFLVGEEQGEISREIALRLTRSAQIFIASGETHYSQLGMRIITMFIELTPSYFDDILIIAEELFLSMGNFPNLHLLNTKWNDRPRLEKSIINELSGEVHRSLNFLEDINLEGTNFQVDLWNTLLKGVDVVTVAPTSTGKSFLIVQYIVQQLVKNTDELTFALIIVPSRALINEFSRKIQQNLSKLGGGHIDVATMGKREHEYDRSTIFILTQERLLMLLHFQPLMSFSLLVVDEAQNIANEARGILLHIAITQVINRGPLQIIFSTPSLEFKETFNSLLDESKVSLESMESPVVKNFIEVSCADRNLVFETHEPYVQVKIRKQFTGSSTANIVHMIGEKSSNIIYANTKSQCENLAKKLANLVKDERDELSEAADYIKETIHAEHSLVNSLMKGVGYHYGPLPRNIRLMIEDSVEDGLIDFLVCTSTLAEGVNLPAKNMFIENPKIGRGANTSMLPKVQYKNIVGRAGRLMSHFSGNVFLINIDNWDFPETLKEDNGEPKLPSYFQVLQEKFDDILATLESGSLNSISDDQDELTISINKIIQDYQQGVIEDSLSQLLNSQQIDQIIRATQSLLEELELPPIILGLNPGIGVIEQNSLYNFLFSFNDINSLVPVHPQNPEFQDYLVRLLGILHQFGVLGIRFFENEQYAKKIRAMTISWVKGLPIKRIINDTIRFGAKQSSNIDTVVRGVVNILETEIRFKMVRAIKCFFDLLVFTLQQRGISKGDILELYPYIEVGASTDLLIQLISIGLTRQTAIEIDEKLQGLRFDDGELLISIISHPLFRDLHAVTRKEVSYLLN